VEVLVELSKEVEGEDKADEAVAKWTTRRIRYNAEEEYEEGQKKQPNLRECLALRPEHLFGPPEQQKSLD
jgi:hypothetical protein